MRIAWAIVTAAGRITCRRCTARSSRTGLQCQRPALKLSETSKCQFHGGRGSGPKTSEGKARIAAVRLVHGKATRAQRAVAAAASARLSQLEDAMYILGMAKGPRTRGRKAKGYVPLRTIHEVRRELFELACTQITERSTDSPEN